jgi:hypothetical protein
MSYGRTIELEQCGCCDFGGTGAGAGTGTGTGTGAFQWRLETNPN